MRVNANNSNNSDDNESSTDQECWHNCIKYAKEYNELTGIHGLRYVTEKRSIAEKIIWAFILLISLGGCIYMIYEILYKYYNTPVVVTFATEDTPIYQIPFPAITICPESKYSRKKINYGELFKKFTKNETLDQEQLNNFLYLSMICDSDLEGLEQTNKTMNKGFYNALEEFKLERNETILACINGEKVQECQSSFTPVLIDEGICYSYNIFDKSEIFKEHVFHHLDYYSVGNISQPFFDVESGYKTNAGGAAYPRRALSSGADKAIVIMLYHNIDNDDIACSPFLKGFRVLVHNPWDIPRLSKHFLFVPFDKIVVASIEPELVTTSDAVRQFAPEKRKCYMRNERPLKHFLQYSQPNCLLECITNYTLSRCGCVQFFMPRDNNTAVCGSGSRDCIEKAEGMCKNGQEFLRRKPGIKVTYLLSSFNPGLVLTPFTLPLLKLLKCLDELVVKEFEAKMTEQPFCDCKPSCSSLNFNVETSNSNVQVKEYLTFHEKIELENLEKLKFSMLQIYFKDEQFITKERNELYGISDLISNLGGLLGLFTGFSLISAAEIIYFCSLRLYYNEKIYGTWSGPSE